MFRIPRQSFGSTTASLRKWRCIDWCRVIALVVVVVTTTSTATTASSSSSSVLLQDDEYLAVLNVLDFGADPTGTIRSNAAFEFVLEVAATMQQSAPPKAPLSPNRTNTHKMIQIVVPPGVYWLRPIQISYSNIHLHLQENVVLRSSTTTTVSSSSLSWSQPVNENEVDYIERTFDTINDDDRYYNNHQIRKEHYHNDFDYDIEETTSTTTRTTDHHQQPDDDKDEQQQLLHWPITPSLQTFGGGREDGRKMRYEAFFSITNVDHVILSGTLPDDDDHQRSQMDGGGLAWWKLYSNRQHHHTWLPYTRPSLLEIRHSTNVQVYGLQFVHSPFWTIHLYNSSAISIHDIHIQNEVEGFDPSTNRNYSSANVDGIDINSCYNVSIYDSHIQTHDDSIVIKSGLDLAGIQTNLSSHDIFVYNCFVSSPVGAGLGIGSEVSGGIYNIYLTNITMYRSMYGVRIKTFHGRGSYIQNVVFTNLHLFFSTNEQYGKASTIVISMFGGNRPHLLRGYNWDDITVIENITFQNVTIYNDPFAVALPPDKTNNPHWVAELLSDIISTTRIPKGGIDDRIRHDANGIHIRGDTNLRRYWSLRKHYNDYIRNISFINVYNLITTPTMISEWNQTEERPGFLRNLDCVNAVDISYNQYQNIVCKDQPYVMLSYDVNQLKRAIRKLFQ